MQSTSPLLGGRYRLGDLLGRGGMASVYRGEDELLGRSVAIKVFAEEAEPGTHDRKRSEMRVLAGLNHPALVTVFDANIDAEPHPYLVMEFVDGPALNERLSSGPIPAADVVVMTRELGEALASVHAAGIVHRDIKPSNVLLASRAGSRGFRAKLADFGIAAIVDAARLTVPGTLMGTAAYLAPEQLRGAAPAPSADIYSLGLVVLECLTGERAFPGTAAESMSRRLTDDPGMPQSVPVAMRALISAMTARNPDDRPSAPEVVRRADAAGQNLTAERTDDALATMAAESTPPVDGPADQPTKVLTAALTEPLHSSPRAAPLAQRTPRRSMPPVWPIIGGAALLAALGIGLLVGIPATQVDRIELPATGEPLGAHLDELLEAVTP